MSVQTKTSIWWQAQLQRGFTKLECGLLGAVFGIIGVYLAITVWLWAQ